MFVWAPLARRAKRTTLSKALLYFVSVQLLLFIPTAYAQLRTEPHAYYARVYGGPALDVFNQLDNEWDTTQITMPSTVSSLAIPVTKPTISVGVDADGYIYSLGIAQENENHVLTTTQTVQPDMTDGTVEPPVTYTYALHISSWLDYGEADHAQADYPQADYVLGITPDYIYYRDAHVKLAMPTDKLPGWVLHERDYYELFNYLALYNGYFTRMLLPMVLLMLAAYLIGQMLFYWAAAWLFGQTRKLTTYMRFSERLVVCVFASVLAVLPGVLLGFIAPVIHILLFEVAVVYVAYKIMREY